MGLTGSAAAAAEGPEQRRGITFSVAIAVAPSAAAGLIHAGAAGSHDGTSTLAMLFALAAILQVGLAFAAIVARQDVMMPLLGAVNAAALVAWGVTRVSGAGAIAGLAGPQPVGIADLSAALLESLAVSAALASVAGRKGPLIRGRAAAAVVAAALIASAPAVVAPHDHRAHREATVAAAGHEHEDGEQELRREAGDQAAPAGGGAAAVDLPDVEGVTEAQKAAAARLVVATRRALERFPDVATAEAAGFVSIGDGRTGYEHFVHRGHLENETILDPDEPESLVFKVEPDGSRTLASAMYILPPGRTMADVPDIAGELTTWHDHQNLCWDATGTRLAGVVVDGRCRPGGTFRPTPPMLHVWVTEHPCGPFAGIDGTAHGGACHSDHSH